MIDKYKDEVEKLIQTNGAMGVNALSKALDIPLSTIQKYMHRQSYFRMNVQRKWDMPTNVTTKEINEAINNFDNVIESQLSGITSLSEMLITQIKSTITILSAQKPVLTPVAALPDKSVNIDPRLINVNEEVQKLKDVFKKQKSNIPDEYVDLLNNYDHVGLYLKEGKDYVTNMLQDELFELLTGQTQTLSEEAIQTLKDNQKE